MDSGLYMNSSFWNGRHVLVTGAGGFIGSHLAEKLVEAGAHVRAFVHYNALGRWGWLDASPLSSRMDVVAGEITDRDSVQTAAADIDTIFHLAALIAIPYSYSAPASYLRVNNEGTLNVLQAARATGARRVVHTSTSEVYGTARYVPIDEAHPLQGQSPYSASKIGADKIAESFFCSFNVPVVTVRPFNTFGPRQSARAVIPTIITQCLSGHAVKLGNLTPTRDMNFVANTVDGFMRAAEVDTAIGQTINLGSGREISIGDLAAMIAQRCGTTLQLEDDAQRMRPGKSEVERLLACNRRAQELLNWTPSVSLEAGLDQTIAWIRQNPDAYRAGRYVV
jgi:NAD dependent epimerase/dehydratase